jgi:hypothetical protein
MIFTKKKLFALVAVAMLLSVVSTGALFNALQAQPTKSNVVSQVTQNIIGTVNVVVRSGNGQILYNETSTHLDPLTSGGSSYMISAISNTTLDGSSNKAVYMGLSNDTTPLVTWTTLPTLIAANGLSITSALTPTYGTCQTTSGTSTYFTVNHTWTCATGNENAVDCAGIYWVSSGASGLLCANTFSPPANLGYANSDTIQVTYKNNSLMLLL